MRRQLTVDAIAARSSLIAEPKPDARAAEFAHQPSQDRRRVGDPTLLVDLAANAALGYRHDDPLLMNIKPDIYVIPSPTTRLLSMRLGARPIRRNPRYLHTVRRVAPSL